MNFCKFCLENNSTLLTVKKRKWERVYSRCLSCGGVSMLPEFFLSEDEQKKRYQNHINIFQNEGYLDFLCDFIFSVFSFISDKEKCRNDFPKVSSLIDYGSGPNPAMIELLCAISSVIYNEKDIADYDFNLNKVFSRINSDFQNISNFIPSSDKIKGWDPFFNTASVLTDESASLVFCLEVAEHFENPMESFKALANVCKKNGIVAAGTLPINSNMKFPEDFENWWYKDDATHVSFYTEDAIKKCGSHAGLEYLGMASERIFMFRKN